MTPALKKAQKKYLATEKGKASRIRAQAKRVSHARMALSSEKVIAILDEAISALDHERSRVWKLENLEPEVEGEVND